MIRKISPLVILISLALLFSVSAKDKKKLKVYILVGQSNMQGTGNVKTLPHMAMDPKTKKLHDKIIKNGKYQTYKNVYVTAISDKGGAKDGPLTIGFGSNLSKPDVCGPELGFGITVDEKSDQPILIIKTSWGGKSLAVDFRPPSAGLPNFGKDPEKLKKASGHYYRLMVEHVTKVLANPGKYHPKYNKKSGYEIAGFAWFQGWNDMVNGGAYPNRYKAGGYDNYTKVMAHFIRDVRKAFKAPKMPFAIGVMGVGGPTKDYKSKRYVKVHQYFRDAMAAPAKMAEFKGNVAAVLTENFYPVEIEEIDGKRRKKQALTEKEQHLLKIGKSNAGFHYLGSLKCYSQVGEALANAIMKMEK